MQRHPSIRDPHLHRSPDGTRRTWRSAHTPDAAPPHWRPLQPSSTPSDRSARPPVRRPVRRSTPPATPTWFVASDQWRSARSDSGSTHGPRRRSAPGFGCPINDQVLTRHRHPRKIRAPLQLPRRFRRRHRAAQVARGARVAGPLDDRQQALGADPAIAGAHPIGDQPLDHGCVAHHVARLALGAVASTHQPLDRLWLVPHSAAAPR